MFSTKKIGYHKFMFPKILKILQIIFYRLTVEWHPPSETKLNQLMQSLTTQLSAIERHEKQLEKLKSNNKHTSCQIQDLLETEYSAMVFAQVRHLSIFCRLLNPNFFFQSEL